MNPENTPVERKNVKQPLYQKVIAMLQQEYLQHQIPGIRLPSERDMSRMLGVSISTIRAALNVLENEGHIERRLGSGTYTIQQPAPGERHVAVLLEADISSSELSSYYPGLLQEVRLALLKRNIPNRPYLGYLRVGFELGELTCRDFLDDLHLKRISGVISISSRKHTSWLSKLQKQNIPLVGAERSADYIVNTDFSAMLHQAFGIMRKNGRNHLAFVCLNTEYSSSIEPLAIQLAAEYQLKLSVFRIPVNATPKELQKFRHAWKTPHHAPDCLMITDDMVFPSIQNALKTLPAEHLGMEDCYVYGADTAPLVFERPFTHCAYSIRQRANQLAESMQLFLNGKTPPQLSTIPFTFIPVPCASTKSQPLFT